MAIFNNVLPAGNTDASSSDVLKVQHVHVFSLGHDTAVVLVTLAVTALTLTTVLAFIDLITKAFRRVRPDRQLRSLFFFVVLMVVLTVVVTVAGNRFLKTRLVQTVRPEDLRELDI